MGQRPDLYGLVLGQDGWISFKTLHKALIQEQGLSHLRLSGIKYFFTTFRPARFEWEAEKVRVRPEYQAPGVWEYVEAEPPERLYCPVRPKSLPHIIEHGLGHVSRPGQLVLATGKDLAERLGKLKGPDTLLSTVLARKAWKSGVKFSVSVKELFITDQLSPEFLLLPPVPRDLKKRGKDKKVKSDKPTQKARSHENPHTRIQAGAFALRPEHLLNMIPHSEDAPEKMRNRTRFEKKKRRKKGRRKA